MKLATFFWLVAVSSWQTEAKIRGVSTPTSRETKDRKLVRVMGFGATPPSNMFPLGLCEGDCDNDTDCEGSLVCYQRDKFEDAPGCDGGTTFGADTDFCAPAIGSAPEPSTDAPTFEPTAEPTLIIIEPALETPATAPTYVVNTSGLLQLEFVGDEITFGLPLGMCQGDCDSDEDCLDDFVCFQREMFEPVPGCAGEGDASIDYCTKDWSGNVAVTMAPVPAPTGPQQPVGGSASLGDQGNLPMLTTVGDDSGLPLGLCEGDCDTDDDCLDNLVCFQRDMLEPVPGCSGQGRISYDYCIMGPPAPEVPQAITMAPSTIIPGPVVEVNPLRPPLDFVGDVEFFVLGTPLGFCQGDCDTDDDCLDDLVCYQRDAFEPVPGCSGRGEEGMDYCTVGFSDELVVSLAPVSTETLPPELQSNLPPLETIGDNLPLPLGMCQGDCDNDDDCLDELVCFQRDLLDPVPGCAGEGQISYDYCTVAPGATLAPTTPTTPPAMRPTTAPGVPVAQLPPLETVGDDLALPLGICQGDCDSDEDCLDDLVCFQRNMLEPVEGCSGVGRVSYDYCTNGPNSTPSPTRPPTVQQNPVDESQLPPLEPVSDDGNPIGLCQGDCDTDDDCLDEFVCFQRDFLEPVPGCSGLGQRSYDYCTVDPSGGPVPTSAPAPAPTAGTSETDMMPTVTGPMLVEIADEGVLPLGLCEGDCDVDSDCLDSFICFQRNYFEPVPGCSGTGRASFDYCIPDPNPPAPTNAPLTVTPATPAPVPVTPPPTDPFVVIAAEEAPVEAAEELPALVIVDSKDDKKGGGKGNNNGVAGVAGDGDSDDEGLGLCEGKCKDTDDCAPGLFCFDGGQAATSIPGCSGDPGGYAFCIPIPTRKLKGARRGRI